MSYDKPVSKGTEEEVMALLCVCGNTRHRPKHFTKTVDIKPHRYPVRESLKVRKLRLIEVLSPKTAQEAKEKEPRIPT